MRNAKCDMRYAICEISVFPDLTESPDWGCPRSGHHRVRHSSYLRHILGDCKNYTSLLGPYMILRSDLNEWGGIGDESGCSLSYLGDG